MIDLGLALLRVVIGLTLAAHGAQKLFGWFGGHKIRGTAQFFSSLGLRPAIFWAVVVGLAEFGGGLLTALGLLGPVGPALLAGNMLGTIILVHWDKGFWNMAGGIEFPLTLGAAAVAIALTGFGRYSLDRAFGIDLHEPVYVVAALVIAVVGALISYVTTLRARQEAGAAARA
jgi:putative oxidoreductase